MENDDTDRKRHNMEREIRVGDFYCHFKNKLYQVKDIAIHSETREKYVVYQALYGDYLVYVRPYDMFLSEVDHAKYPDVKQTYRFTKVILDKDGNRSYPEEKAEFAGPDAGDAKKVVMTDAIAHVGEKASSKKSYTWGDIKEGEPHPALMAFLDTDDYEEKYNILVSLRDEITDDLIDSLSVSVDAVIPDGPTERRYDELKSIVRTRQRYEFTNRFR